MVCAPVHIDEINDMPDHEAIGHVSQSTAENQCQAYSRGSTMGGGPHGIDPEYNQRQQGDSCHDYRLKGKVRCIEDAEYCSRILNVGEIH